jgi:molybdopterin converting factor small subunit
MLCRMCHSLLLDKSKTLIACNIRAKLASTYPKLASLVQDEESITLAVNAEYVAFGETKILRNGDTVALIPPISGG